MPTAPCRLCPGCGALVTRRCPTCSSADSKRRGSAASRGYDAAWRRFRAAFVARLVDLGLSPICGAALPGGPVTQDSACLRHARVTLEGLHFDHTPPLTDAERASPAAVCNFLRVQLLCAACHTAKTSKEHARPR